VGGSVERARSLIVQKYGGTSVGDAERIKRVAERVAGLAKDHDVVVTVSAMGHTTDELIALAAQVSRDPSDREMDQLLVTGEQISASLVAMALIDRGQPAVSLTAGQAGIRTTGLYTKARITDIHPERIRRELDQGRVPIVTGFQGMTADFDVTTLGRGGSDTTAVALAAALHSERCEILTDVQGIYTADPRIVPSARKLDQISYEEMLELASLGARVMHPRAVELGEVYDVPIMVRSSFSDAPGTLITRIENVEVRKNVRGIAHDTDVAKIRIVGVPDRPGIAAAIFNPLADAAISVDTIVQNTSLDGKTDLSFTVSRADHARAAALVETIVPSIGASGLDHSEGLAKVSVVGTGMQSAPGYAARMFKVLAASSINIDMITTSDIRITCMISADQVEAAMNALHAAFELDQE
jgi:aspartate kinase